MDTVNRQPFLDSIHFLAGPLVGKTILINKSEVTFGRDPTNDIVISDPAVSRQHAEMCYQNGFWSIKKLAPANTVVINQRNVEQAAVYAGDAISLGPNTTFLLLIPQVVQTSARSVSGKLAKAAVHPAKTLAETLVAFLEAVGLEDNSSSSEERQQKIDTSRSVFRMVFLYISLALILVSLLAWIGVQADVISVSHEFKVALLSLLPILAAWITSLQRGFSVEDIYSLSLTIYQRLPGLIVLGGGVVWVLSLFGVIPAEGIAAGVFIICMGGVANVYEVQARHGKHKTLHVTLWIIVFSGVIWLGLTLFHITGPGAAIPPFVFSVLRVWLDMLELTYTELENYSSLTSEKSL